MSSDENCRVLIVDDHEIVRSGLSLLLKTHGYELAGIVKTGAEVIPFLQTEAIDIVLLDLGLPDVHGLTVLAELVGVHDASVIVLSGDLDAPTCDAAMKLGARALVSKSDPTLHILKALSAVQSGKTFATPSVDLLLAQRRALSVSLSPRQKERWIEFIRHSEIAFLGDAFKLIEPVQDRVPTDRAVISFRPQDILRDLFRGGEILQGKNREWLGRCGPGEE